MRQVTLGRFHIGHCSGRECCLTFLVPPLLPRCQRGFFVAQRQKLAARHLQFSGIRKRSGNACNDAPDTCSSRQLRRSGSRLDGYPVGDHEDKQHQSEKDKSEGVDIFSNARVVMVVDQTTAFCTKLIFDLQTEAVPPAGGIRWGSIVRQVAKTVCELVHTSLSGRHLILGAQKWSVQHG